MKPQKFMTVTDSPLADHDFLKLASSEIWNCFPPPRGVVDGETEDTHVCLHDAGFWVVLEWCGLLAGRTASC
ncbi:hypothetical protein ACIRS3_35515 [Streptomyces virginiae]|uniref:hypothetical protein n=1 Tax=Streptomyces virginiae TaxID=1961 RepID=UPI00381CCF79